MFIREQLVRQGERQYRYLKIVENVWEQGATRQKTLVNLGNVAHWSEAKLREAARQLASFVGVELSDPSPIEFGDCRQLGPGLLLSTLWTQLDLDGIIKEALLPRRIELRVADYARAMVLNRLIAPGSKKAVWEWLGHEALLPGLNEAEMPLHGYYRALEYLSGVKVAIEQALHQRVKNLFNQDLSLVLYDLTSTYFEGTHCARARHGYSRDHRPDLLQIEIGLLVDAEGIPIGHEVFDGNVKDVSTVLLALERLKGQFGIRRCIFVGDNGMASEKNLKAVEEQGYEYITSVPLGKSAIGRQLVTSLPKKERFERIEEDLWLRSLGQEGRVRYVGSYNPERARCGRRHRRRRMRDCMDYLRDLQAPPKPRGRRRKEEEAERKADRFLGKKGCRAFFHVFRDEAGRLAFRRDRAAHKEDWRRDGLLVLSTNSATLSNEEVARAYRTLWRVENAFRHIKDVVELRPIRHWNDARVLGHVFVCVLAYMMERLLEKRLNAAGVKMSTRAAIQQMRSLMVATLDFAGQSVRRRSRLTTEQSQLLAALGVHDVPAVW